MSVMHTMRVPVVLIPIISINATVLGSKNAPEEAAQPGTEEKVEEGKVAEAQQEPEKAAEVPAQHEVAAA